MLIYRIRWKQPTANKQTIFTQEIILKIQCQLHMAKVQQPTK
jgi:hypothetical protein